MGVSLGVVCKVMLSIFGNSCLLRIASISLPYRWVSPLARAVAEVGTRSRNAYADLFARGRTVPPPPGLDDIEEGLKRYTRRDKK